MNPDVINDLIRRLDKLERTAVRYRAGEITDTSPLSVALGGSDVAYEDVRALAHGPTVGDQVAALVFGNDLLVLGRIAEAAGFAVDCGTGTATWTTNKNSAVVTVAHTLGRTPTYASATSRDVTIDYSVVARDSDSIDVRGFTSDGTAISDTLTFDWLAIA